MNKTDKILYIRNVVDVVVVVVVALALPFKHPAYKPWICAVNPEMVARNVAVDVVLSVLVINVVQ
jgi:hypothetical protein